jgi:hypothetical protein
MVANRARKALDVDNPSAFIDAVGGLPDGPPNEIAFFEGLAAGVPYWRDAIREIIHAVGEHGAICLEAEY